MSLICAHRAYQKSMMQLGTTALIMRSTCCRAGARFARRKGCKTSRPLPADTVIHWDRRGSDAHIVRRAVVGLPPTSSAGTSRTGQGPPPPDPQPGNGKRTVEQLDYTLTLACQQELQQIWVPAKVQRTVLADPTTLALGIRTIDRQGWLFLSWHPVAARVCTGAAPDRGEASSSYPFAELARSRCVSLCQGRSLKRLHKHTARTMKQVFASVISLL
jgi:hypothetical protein